MSIFPSREAALAAFPRATESFLRRNVIGEASTPPAPTPPSLPVPGLKTPPRQPKQAKKGRQMVARTRNGGAWTEARYYQALRSALRRAFRFWGPAVAALKASRVPMSGPRGRKWGYVCAGCGKVFMRREVEIDHKERVGSLTSLEHLPEFIRRLTPESPDAYQILCSASCHLAKTNAERAAK